MLFYVLGGLGGFLLLSGAVSLTLGRMLGWASTGEPADYDELEAHR